MDNLEKPPAIQLTETDSQQDQSGTAGIETEKETKKKVSRLELTNRLNYINFQNRFVLIHFAHNRYDRTISLKALPQPCINEHLVCLWPDERQFKKLSSSYHFQSLTIPNGQKMISVDASPRMISSKGICLILPEAGFENRARQVVRHKCKGLKIQLIQNGVFFSGTLIDFSAISFRISLKADPPQTFQWINPKSKVNIIFSNAEDNLFSGECRIIKQTSDQLEREFVLEPLSQVIQRFKPKEYRSQRFILTPSPDMIFDHPITKKLLNLKVIDLSGSGFSVEDNQSNAALMAGMIIPSLELNLANSFSVQCKAQVVYRAVQDEEKNGNFVKCGLTFLDMDLNGHRQLLSLLHQVGNQNSYISSKVDLDDLWRFFFEAGFIYPGKYSFISENKEKIKQTYKKLYTENPSIATHFICRKKGLIQGHMSMLRFYENTWLIHHHAALKSSMIKAGLVVLDQIGKFTYDSHRLYSSHMDYLICYYRPENKFPNQIFGGAVKSIENPKAFSLDSFSYTHFRKSVDTDNSLPESWSLEKPLPVDLHELESFYERESGGLMLKALDLEPGSVDRFDLSKGYATLGFKRERLLFALKKNGILKAVLMLNTTDIALNMSDLTNCIKIIILDPQSIKKEIICKVVSFLSKNFEQKKFPVLIYPSSFAEEEKIPFEKMYNLWTMNVQYSDEYFKHVGRLLKLQPA